MRTFSTLRALVLAAVLTAPLAQAAQPQQQAFASGHAASTPSYGGGPYDSDAAMSPAVGD